MGVKLLPGMEVHKVGTPPTHHLTSLVSSRQPVANCDRVLLLRRAAVSTACPLSLSSSRCAHACTPQELRRLHVHHARRWSAGPDPEELIACLRPSSVQHVGLLGNGWVERSIEAVMAALPDTVTSVLVDGACGAAALRLGRDEKGQVGGKQQTCQAYVSDTHLKALLRRSHVQYLYGTFDVQEYAPHVAEQAERPGALKAVAWARGKAPFALTLRTSRAASRSRIPLPPPHTHVHTGASLPRA